MTELNFRARKNALRAITCFEKKHNINLKNRKWSIESSEHLYTFDELIKFIESLDWRFNCGFKVEVSFYTPIEICLFCDEKYLAHTTVKHLNHAKL